MPQHEIDQRLRRPDTTLRALPRTLELDRVETREAEDGSIEFVGHAAVFGELSEVLYDMWGPFRERLIAGCFEDVIAANADGREDTKFLGLNHDRSFPLARCGNSTLQLEEDETGLLARATLAPTARARELATLLDRRDVHQMSFTFTTTKDGEKWTWDADGDVREITGVARLYDVSPVVYPAYPQTDAGLRELAQARALAEEIEAGRRSADPEHLAALGRLLEMADEMPAGLAERARRALSAPEPSPPARDDADPAERDERRAAFERFALERGQLVPRAT